MTKDEFLIRLCTRLNNLHPDDIEESIAYYTELIDDRVEGGEDEEDIVASLGSIDSIVEQIIAEMPMASVVKSRVKPKRRLKAGEIVLISVGAPVWLPLFIAVIAIVFSVYVTLWSIVATVFISTFAVVISVFATLWALTASLCIITFSFITSILGGIAGICIFTVVAEPIKGLIFLSFGFVLCGIGMLLIKPCIGATKGMIDLSKNIMVLIKPCIVATKWMVELTKSMVTSFKKCIVGKGVNQ